MELSTKQKLAHELKRLLIYTVFFTLFFWAFTTYRRLILGEHGIDYIAYVYSFVEALILSKIIILGEVIGLGKRYSGPPLIIPTLYNSIIFSLFVFAFTILEHIIKGWFKHQGVMQTLSELKFLDYTEIAARVFIMFFVFILFFAFLAVQNQLGEKKLFKLFFSRDK